MIPIYTYFSHIRKSHHTLVNIKSPNYEIKGMNYNIKSMYILIMRYVNMMTYNYEIKDQNYEMKLQVMKKSQHFYAMISLCS